MKNLTSTLVGLRSNRSQLAGHVNRAGAPSYQRSLKEQVLAVLSTGTLGDTFYASRDELAKEAVEVLTEARTECPHFLARALVWAREEGMMKTLPVLGLVVLSAGGGKTKSLFEQVFARVVKTPDDLRSFVTIVKSGAIAGRKGLGGMTVEPVRKYLANMSEYHTLKYGSANSEGVTLADIVRLAHPKPGTPETAERFGWLVRGKTALAPNESQNPQIHAFETLKKAATEDEQISLVRGGRLPFEVVVPTLKQTTTGIWSELLRQAPYRNLLSNLATFTRHGVFKIEENVAYAVAKLTDREAIRRSKVLPFRFFNAWKVYSQIEGNDVRLSGAIRTALNLSFESMPTFGSASVAIGPDVSGSMSTTCLSQESTTRCIDIAGIFTGALMRKIEGRAVVLPFDTHVHTADDFSLRDVLDTAERIAEYGGGGTALGAPIDHLLRSRVKVDVFIGITDNEDWAYGREHSVEGSFLNLWHRYKGEIAPDAKAFLVTVAPYRDAVAPTGTKDVHFIYGWSDRVLNYIGLKLQSGRGQVELVETMEI